MSEKIKLTNGQEFNLIPMGIYDDIQNKRRLFKFVSNLAYSNIKTMFSNSANLVTVDYILESGEVSKTYTDCISLKQLSVDFGVLIGEETVDVYTVSISLDAIEKQLVQVTNKLNDTESSVNKAKDDLLTVENVAFSTMELLDTIVNGGH